MLYWVKICFGENEREQYVVADEIELFLIFLLHGKVVTDEALITDYRQTFEDRYLLYKQGIESKESSDFSDTYKKNANMQRSKIHDLSKFVLSTKIPYRFGELSILQRADF